MRGLRQFSRTADNGASCRLPTGADLAQGRLPSSTIVRQCLEGIKRPIRQRLDFFFWFFFCLPEGLESSVLRR